MANKIPRREFHFVSGNSSKFWAIELSGSSFDVNYGKLGTNGRTQTKEFASGVKAKEAYEKLITEKSKKGYVEVDSESESDPNDVLSPAMFSTTPTSRFSHLTMFIGKKVTEYTGPACVKKTRKVYAFRYSYGEDSKGVVDLLDSFAQTDGPEYTTGLVIGNYGEYPSDAEPIVNKLVELKDRFPNLVAVFLGDMEYTDCEVSWIENCDMTPLLNAFPKLELLRVRGGTGVRFKSAKHENLRALAIESGGLGRDAVAQICKAKFPKLEYLELWLGTDSYGGDCRVNDLQPILSGKSFSNLEYLGLRNSEIVDEIAGVVASSPILQQIEILDLSLGTMTDEGGKALLNIPQKCKLEKIDVCGNFLTNESIKDLKKLHVTVVLKSQRKPDDWGDGPVRFVSIGE